MKIINEQRDDLTLEGMTIVAGIMSKIYAAEIEAYRLADALDKQGARGTMVQRKKQALRQARRYCGLMISCLETAFDQHFDRIVMREGAEFAGVRDAEFHALACEVSQLVLLFLTISEGATAERRANIFKALRNFKPLAPIDTDGLLKFFEYKE